jgi:hypothetical protein
VAIRLPRNPVHDPNDAILPALVTAVLRDARGHLADVDTSPPLQSVPVPETIPAIRVRAKNRAWVDADRLIGQVIVITFSSDGPLIVDPFDLIDRYSGSILPEFAKSIPGADLKIKRLGSDRIKNAREPGRLTRVIHRWSALVTLAEAGGQP